MKDVESYYKANPIERINKASDKCLLFESLGEGACDGTGFIWLKDNLLAMKVANGTYVREIGEDKKPKMIEWQEPCKCMEVRKRAKLINSTGIPEKFRTARLSNFSLKYTTAADVEIATYAKEVATKFVDKYQQMKESEDGAKGLYLYSKTKGSGKSRLLSTISNELTLQGVDTMYINATNVAKEVRNTFNSDSELSELEVTKALVDAEVLCIDDLAVEKPSRFVEDLYYKIFNERYEQKKTTIIASNLTIKEFGSQKYMEGKKECSYADEEGGSRTGSRLNAMCYELFIPEESIRKREAKYQNKQFEKMLFGGD